MSFSDEKKEELKYYIEELERKCGVPFSKLQEEGSTALENPMCIEALYDTLDRENALEWQYALGEWWKMQFVIAIGGLPLSWLAMFCALYSLAFPYMVPNIDEVPWHDAGDIKKTIVGIMLFTAHVVKADYFFASQFLTFGLSDWRDFELLFMTPLEATMYFFTESLLLPFMQLNSMMFFLGFWWIYYYELYWVVHVVVAVFTGLDL